MVKSNTKKLNIVKIIRIIVYIFILSLLIIIPIEKIESRSICIIYNLFGVKCFGCGITRAYANILRLNLGKAIEYNSLILIIFPLSLFIMINEIYTFIKKKKSVIDKILSIIYNKDNVSVKIFNERSKNNESVMINKDKEG